jgi:tRNA(Met) C34 N-acetyltransferase TmcA
MTFGNSSSSKWPSRKIPSSSFAARRGDFSGNSFKNKISKIKESRSDARKKIIDSMSFEIDKDQIQKEKNKKEEAEIHFYKNLKLSEESKDIIDTLENSSENLFITGRAGTGKSTLLGYFRNTTKKNVVVVAPTGVAALNVRGQTIHGFFKFKIGVTIHDIKKVTAEVDQKMKQDDCYTSRLQEQKKRYISPMQQRMKTPVLVAHFGILQTLLSTLMKGRSRLHVLHIYRMFRTCSWIRIF